MSIINEYANMTAAEILDYQKALLIINPSKLSKKPELRSELNKNENVQFAPHFWDMGIETAYLPTKDKG